MLMTSIQQVQIESNATVIVFIILVVVLYPITAWLKSKFGDGDEIE